MDYIRMLAHRDAEKEREESISSLQPTPESDRAAFGGSFQRRRG